MPENTPVYLTEEPGQTLVLDLHDPGDGTASASDLTLSESGNAPGEYSTTVTTAVTGLKRASVKSSGTVIAVYEVIMYDITDKLTCVELGTAAAREAAAYPGRRIFIDTVNGTAGTVPCENGTVNAPVDSWADAKTLAATLGYSEFYVVSGSTLTLTSSAAGYNFDGENYSFYANGKDINGTIVRRALVYMATASATNSTTQLIDCRISLIKTGATGIIVRDSLFVSASTHLLDGACKFYNCRCDTLQNNPPIFDFQGSGGLPYTTAVFMDWVGDLRLKRVYAAATVHIYGRGDVTIDSDCTGGLIKVVGMRPPIDNVSGGFDNLTYGTLDYEPLPADMTRINGSPEAAQAVQETHADSDRLVVDDTDFEPTTTAFETDGTDTADNTFKGRTGTWFNASGSPANKGSFFIISSEGTTTNANDRVKIFIDPLRPMVNTPAAGDVFRVVGARTQ